MVFGRTLLRPVPLYVEAQHRRSQSSSELSPRFSITQMQPEQIKIAAGSSHGAARILRVPVDGRSAALMLCLAAAGFLASAGAYAIAQRYSGPGVLLVLGSITLGPIALVSAAWAVPQARRKLAALIQKLTWWHGLWFLLYFTAMIGGFRRLQDLSVVNPTSIWSFLRMGPELFIAGVLLVRLVRHRPAWSKYLFAGLPGVLALYALMCTTSSLWSAYPTWTAYKSTEYLLDIAVLAAGLASIRSLEDYESLFNWTWTIFAVELAWVWAQWPLWPSQVFGDEGRLGGIYPSFGFNLVGQSGAFLAVLALCRLWPLSGRNATRALYTWLFAFGVASLLLSRTRNALAGFVVAVMLVLILSKRYWLVALASGFGAIVWAFSRASTAVMTYVMRDQTEGAFTELTGRADPWSYAWDLFRAHPLTGLGAYAGGRFVVMQKVGGMVNMHSDWMELLVGIGCIGLIPFAIAVLGSWWYLLRSVHNRALKWQERQMALEATGVLCVIFVHSFFNDELTWHAPLLLLVTLGYAEMLRRRGKGTTLRPLRTFLPAQ
jgi:O-antigen ligase